MLARGLARLHRLLHGLEVDGWEQDSVSALTTRAEKLVWDAGFKTAGAWYAWLLEYYETDDLRKLSRSTIREIIDILEEMPTMKAESAAATQPEVTP